MGAERRSKRWSGGEGRGGKGAVSPECLKSAHLIDLLTREAQKKEEEEEVEEEGETAGNNRNVSALAEAYRTRELHTSFTVAPAESFIC